MILESGQFLNTEGSGLYQLQSACNHSCAPNAESSFPYGNHRIQLKAIRNIKPGDEIHISYLDDCTLQRSRHSRQRVSNLKYSNLFYFLSLLLIYIIVSLNFIEDLFVYNT